MRHPSPFSPVFCLGAVICLLPLAAGAQTLSPSVADASRRTEGITSRPAVTPLRSDVTLATGPDDSFDAFAPTTPGDNDIGEQLILREREKLKTLFFTADAFLFWTDNAAHVAAGEQEDTFWGSRVAVNWQPRITNKLFGDVGLAQSWFRYDQFDALNFESLEATAGLVYVEPRLANTAFFLQYEYGRLTHEFDALMNSHSLRVGAQKVFLINWRNSISLGLTGDFDLATDVDTLKRNEYIFDAAWLYKATRTVDLTLSYRYTYFDYAQGGRNDSFHGFGFNVIYSPRKWLQLYLGIAYSLNDSNLDVFEYEALNLGGGLGLRIKF